MDLESMTYRIHPCDECIVQDGLGWRPLRDHELRQLRDSLVISGYYSIGDLSEYVHVASPNSVSGCQSAYSPLSRWRQLRVSHWLQKP
jgi:hypothetical protein